MTQPPITRTARTDWSSRREHKRRRLERVAPYVEGKLVRRDAIVAALEALLTPGDRVVLEGDNQKQADFLSRALAQVDPARVHDIRLLIPCITRPEHLTLFERGIARRVDFSFAGPQSVRVAQLLEEGKLEIGSIDTYIELYARMLVELTPRWHWCVQGRVTGRVTFIPAPIRRTARPSSKPRRSVRASCWHR